MVFNMYRPPFLKELPLGDLEYMKTGVECKAKRPQDMKKGFGPALQITITKCLHHD
jgi:hypothetical protein